jgi:nucleotide-binding universal stress UspA family protein
MAIKNILVQLVPYVQEDALIELAAGLANTHGAKLSGLCVLPLTQIPGFARAYVTDEMMAQQRRQSVEAVEGVKSAFVAAAEAQGVPSDWVQANGDPRAIAIQRSRCADLIMVSQSQPGRPTGNGYDLAEELVLTSGRPVLAVPYVGSYPTAGSLVMVAWNGTREATRAVHDALPILAEAKRVIVFGVNPQETEQIASAEITEHLILHGVKAEAHHTVAPDLEVGDALLSSISDYGVDMLVMGAYGHSRLREFALGGATRHLLRHMTAPVLMSH